VWSDVARNYPLNSDMTSISGYSMGGYGTFKFAARYPDLFAKAHTIVGPPGLGILGAARGADGHRGTNTFHLFA